MIFKDDTVAFSKITRWKIVWQRQNGPRFYVSLAQKHEPYNACVGGMFYNPGGSAKQRTIHGKYASKREPKNPTRFLKLAAPQWTSRGQRYHNDGTFLVYNAAALTHIANNVAFPYLWVSMWGNPIPWDAGWDTDRHHAPYGLPDFLNKKFMDDFSYFAAPWQMRARSGAGGGKKPAKVKFSKIVLYHHKIWKDTSPLLNGMRIRMAAIGRYSKMAGDRTVHFTDKCISCSTEWRITEPK